MSLAYKSVLKRHRLITLPWISVNFLSKRSSDQSLDQVLFHVYAKTLFQTPWAGEICKLARKNIASLLYGQMYRFGKPAVFPAQGIFMMCLCYKSNSTCQLYSALKPEAFVEI